MTKLGKKEVIAGVREVLTRIDGDPLLYWSDEAKQRERLHPRRDAWLERLALLGGFLLTEFVLVASIYILRILPDQLTWWWAMLGFLVFVVMFAAIVGTFLWVLYFLTVIWDNVGRWRKRRRERILQRS